MHDLREVVAGVPVRRVWSGDPGRAAWHGVVLFHHGFGASIAGQSKELLGLASRGFMAVGVDAVAHGVRRANDFEARFRGPFQGKDSPFLATVLATADETPGLVDGILAMGLGRVEGFGLAGISMGGYATYAALVAEPRIRVAVALLGNPQWDHPRSPHRRSDAFADRALLSLTAGEDQNVPPDPARRFHAGLAQGRPGCAAPVYRERPGVPHFMPEADWDATWGEALAWFERWLPPGN